jgi:ABC-2 type transport system ATP-binding protein
MAVIETFNLTKKFNKITAVDNLNLQIEEGEVFGLLGPNGAGKTTTIKMLATLLKPTSGSAKVNGFDILKEPSQVRKSIGIVFQEPSSDDLLTGYENLKLHALMYGIPKSEIEKSINEVLELVELSERRNDIVKKYSGGMRRRLEIARGLMHKPKILFLDEPTLGLDPSGRKKMWEYIQRLVKELNVTILLTTHYMEEADFLADRVGIIDHGKIVALDSPAALKKIVGGDLITLKADAPDLSSLRKVSYIRKVEEVDGKIFLTVENVAENLPKILKLINGVQSVEVRSPTLNDVFLHFTGRQIQEEAEGGWFEKIVQQSVVKE